MCPIEMKLQILLPLRPSMRRILRLSKNLKHLEQRISEKRVPESEVNANDNSETEEFEKLCILGQEAQTQYNNLQGMDDVNMAIDYFQNSLCISSSSHHDWRSLALDGLANCLEDWYKQQGVIQDLEDAIQCYKIQRHKFI